MSPQTRYINTSSIAYLSLSSTTSSSLNLICALNPPLHHESKRRIFSSQTSHLTRIKHVLDKYIGIFERALLSLEQILDLKLISPGRRSESEKSITSSIVEDEVRFSDSGSPKAEKLTFLFSQFARPLSFWRKAFLFLIFILFWTCKNSCYVAASEFPERECCDPIYPVTTSTTPVPPSAITVPAGKEGLNFKTSLTILNCLLARQLCFEDASCSAILEIIPRVCGSELVACSTVTVTKCQAALRTLQAFPFFKPTCLCREPNVDPECNSFRDFLFDHPCVFVLKKEKDPYPVEALPTCNYALQVCHNERSCASLYDTFKAACRARDGDCRMDDREQCREAWAGLRMSPLFGCICPNNHMKKRCDRIFAMVNHNPCVEQRTARGGQDLFLTRWLRLRHAPRRPAVAPPTDRHPDRFNLHPSKLPESNKANHNKTMHKAASLEYKSNITRYLSPDGTILLVTENGTKVMMDAGGGDLIWAIIRAMSQRSRASSSSSGNRRHPNATRSRSNPVNAVSSDGKKITPNKTSTTSGDWVSGVDVIPDDGLEIDENHVSPHVMEEGHRRLYGRPGRRKGGTGTSTATKSIHGSGHSDGPKRIGSGENGPDNEGDVMKVSLHSTCHLALDRCIRDKSCTTSLTPVLQTCDASRCDREGCMEALRNFYRTPNVQWNLEIAFCLCKRTDNKEDPCMNAQEKLHPICAQREPGAPLPACHVLAQSCREQPECRNRLELYEQSCAVDSVTKKCAGSPEACRLAVLDMLGTELRTACACKGTDYTQLYDCLGWQRLLWLNPCVVESQSDFHIKTYGSGSTPSMLDNVIRTVHISAPDVTFHQHTTTIYKPHPTFPTSATIVIPIDAFPTKFSNIQMGPNSNGGRKIEVEIQGSGKTIIPVPTMKPRTTTIEIIITEPETTTTTIPTTVTEEETTTTTLATTTTPEPIKYCIVQRPELDDQFVQKGHTRRLYRDTELDCSELCHCDGQLSVSCHAVCVQHAPCRTALAFYSHAAPAYQAYRGRCYCYSGNFICMRPNPGEYSLAPGVYLLLGFSSQDEALLRPHTRLGLEDAVRVLQEYMVSLTDDGTNCTLTLFNVTNENMIVTASVPPNQKERNASPLALLDTDKIECIGLLEIIKSKINSQDYDISSHLLLSIFKIAEVDVVYPPPSGSPSYLPQGPSAAAVALWAMAALIQNYQCCHRTMLSMLHLALLTTLNICTKSFKADCQLVVRNFIKCIIHKSMLAIIVAHFLYYIKNFLLLSLSYIMNIIDVFYVEISEAFSMAYLMIMPVARLSYEKMCFLLTLALRCYFKICQIHIKSAVNLTASAFAVFLSVKCNFKKVDMVVLSCLTAVAVNLTHGSLVNLANLAFITRPKTDVFILFYKPNGSPIFLANYISIAIVIIYVEYKFYTFPNGSVILNMHCKNIGMHFNGLIRHFSIVDVHKSIFNGNVKCLDYQRRVCSAQATAVQPSYFHSFVR